VSWLPCTEAPPGYQVSDTSLVKNPSGRVLRGSTFPNGYRGIVFQGGGKCYLIHRLVLSAFVRPAEGKETANHTD
jgi:hypothetical protein